MFFKKILLLLFLLFNVLVIIMLSVLAIIFLVVMLNLISQQNYIGAIQATLLLVIPTIVMGTWLLNWQIRFTDQRRKT